MSLSSQVANAKAAQAHPVAKRGMFALIERRHRYMTLLAGGLSEHVSFTPAIVTSVSRDGMVKEVRCAGGTAIKRRDWYFAYVDSRGLVADPEHVVEGLIRADGLPQRFDTLAAAQAAIKSAL